MKKFLKKIQEWLFSKIRDERFFYENYRNSFSAGWFIYGHLLKPGRTLRRLKKNKSKRFNLLNVLVRKTNPKIGTNVRFDHNSPDDSFCKIDLALRTHGAVVIEDYFDAQTIDKFSELYKNAISKIKSQESRFGEPLTLSKELLDIWLDPNIYQLISRYFGTKAYCRSYPMLQYVDNNSTQKFSASKKGIAYPWHIDHCTIMAQMIYLSEIRPEGTCMEIVSGSHNFPNIASGLYSSEYIENCGLEVKKLTGSIGSIQIHDPNLVHRAYPVSGSDRFWLFSDFSWGENILLNLPNLVGMLSNSEVVIDSLPPYQQDALSGIFPKTPLKGYQIENGYLTPQIIQEL